MRFKASIEQDSLNLLTGILSFMEKVGKSGVIYLTSRNFRIADSPKVFTELDSMNIFQEYRIESQNGNTILFEIGLDHLSRALQSSKNGISCILKLVKRNLQANLSVETRATDALIVDVSHDIPIKILKPTDIYHYVPPEVPPPTVSLELPHGRLLRTVTERLSKISKNMYLDCGMSGQLVLRVESSAVTIKTFFNSLVPYHDMASSAAGTDSSLSTSNSSLTNTIRRKASIKVELRKLNAILNYQSSLLYEKSYLFVTQNEALVLHINLLPPGTGTVTCYTPTIIDFEYEP